MSFCAVSILLVLLLSFVADGDSASCQYQDCVSVSNQCNVTLYVQRTSLDGPEGLPTHVATFTPGQTQVIDISGWQGLSGQRLYAWWVNPLAGGNPNGVTMRDKVEINLCGSASAPNMCYNPTAVDYFALPVNIGPMNPSDCSGVPMTGANLPLSAIRSGCPTSYVSTPPLGVCESPGASCAQKPSQAICSALDSVIGQCVNSGNCQSGVTTPQVYGCSGWMAQQPKWCSAINRGVYPAVAAGGNEDDPTKFYQAKPFNEYAAWIHTGLAKEYAFPYDDYGGEGASGYNSCTTNFLKVVWCPKG